MIKGRKGLSKERRKAIARSMQEITERAEGRKERGRDPFHADWQATLEIMLLMMEKHTIQHPGQLLPMQINGQKEWEFYLYVLEELDLPPDACAVLITPSAFKELSDVAPLKLETADPKAWERNVYSVIISGWQDRTRIMQASLPGLETVGIDVYEDGGHLGDYTYRTIEECLADLAKITWTYFRPRREWTEEQIIRYSENWFAKTIDLMDLESVKIHTEYSYAHHPELLGLSPLKSVFKLVEATVPRQYDSLEDAIQNANDLNRDLSLGEPTITKKGILKGKEPECQALLNRITVEIDQRLDLLQYLKGVRFPHRDIRDPDYNGVFDETARRIYQQVTGRGCPRSLRIS